MRTLRLYPNREVKGFDFTGCKVFTVPMQFMTLREIIKRFVRRESLPVEKEGVYQDRMGDLEKMARQDITYQMEHVDFYKKAISNVRAVKKAEADKFEADRPGGPVLTPPPQAKSAGGGEGAASAPPVV